MDGFAYTDIDRSILLQSDNRTFLKLCSLNKHFKLLCEKDNYLLYRQKLEKDYPDILISDNINFKTVNWKYLYLKTIKKIAQIKEKYNYNYIGGDIDKQLSILSTLVNTEPFTYYNSMITLAVINSEINLVKYALEMKQSSISSLNLLKRAYIAKNSNIIKLLIDNGAV